MQATGQRGKSTQMKDEDKVTDELRKELVELREQIAKLTKTNISLEKQISEYKKKGRAAYLFGNSRSGHWPTQPSFVQ